MSAEKPRKHIWKICQCGRLEANLFVPRTLYIAGYYFTNDLSYTGQSPHSTTIVCKGPVNHFYGVKKTPF